MNSNLSFRIFLILLLNSFLIGQSISQSYYKSTPWINSFLEKRPDFSRVNIKVDGECQLDKFFVNRKGYKDNYGTIYKDSLCNVYASSGKFEIGLRIDSFQNLYYWQELILTDSNQINLDIAYSELQRDFDLTKLLLEQNIKNDTIEWIQVSQNHWFSIVDTLKIYKQKDSLKIEWTSRKEGRNSKYSKMTRAISPQHLDLLKTIERHFIDPPDRLLYEKYKNNCKDSYSYHILTYRNVQKGYIERNYKDHYWRAIRDEIVKEK